MLTSLILLPLSRVFFFPRDYRYVMQRFIMMQQSIGFYYWFIKTRRPIKTVHTTDDQIHQMHQATNQADKIERSKSRERAYQCTAVFRRRFNYRLI